MPIAVKLNSWIVKESNADKNFYIYEGYITAQFDSPFAITVNVYSKLVLKYTIVGLLERIYCCTLIFKVNLYLIPILRLHNVLRKA